MEKKMLFLSPLEAEMYEWINASSDPDDVLNGNDLLNYQEEIRKAVEESNKGIGSNLMEYYGKKDSVREKVSSLEIAVVEHNGELKGCAVATVSSWLSRQEQEQVKEYLTGQYADGWGEGFEQTPIEAGDTQLYVHFWNRKDFQFEILRGAAPLEKAEPEQTGGLKMQIDLKKSKGNIFEVEGKAIRTLCEAGRGKEVDEMDRRVRESHSYYRALDIINEYVRIVPDYRKQLQIKHEKKRSDRER